ncbi:MAG: tetratricopeptide repeat protein [Gemmatimonadales bacterium]|nr:MAG: tetratricopeptide repeat protein [Gemmatimonadales bacterium]
MKASDSGYQRFFAELKRRRVFRVMAVYGAVAFVVLQVADILQEGLRLPDSFLPVATAVLLLGFPIAIVLAWAFESTPEGIKRTEQAAPGELREIISAPASQRWPAGMLALVGVTALLAGAWYVGRQSAPATAADAAAGRIDASIAVLPFVNMSSDEEQEYFSDGISEELLNLLAKIPELQVAARTSSFSFKGQNLEIPEIARRLNVAHVLEGSVRKSDDQVRITAQLIRADDGFHLWSETWDRTLEDIFAIQDEIAADVAEQLQVTLLGAAPTAEETDPQAYSLFLQARHLGRQGAAGAYEQSNALYEQALAIDPDYAAAWTNMANNYINLGASDLLPLGEANQLAQDAVNRALAIDRDYAMAYAILGRLTVSSDNNLATAAPHYERALELEPTNPEIIGRASLLVRDLGRLDESISLLEYALARDPVSALGHNNLGRMYLWAGRLDEAIASNRTALNLSPGLTSANYDIGTALLLKGEPEAALAAFAQEEADEEFRVKGTALALWELGRQAEYEAAFTDLRERWGERWPSEIAHVYAWTGDADAAFEWLGRAIAQNEDGLTQQCLQPHYASLRKDPRWASFREHSGTSEAQLAAIKFEVRLPE